MCELCEESRTAHTKKIFFFTVHFCYPQVKDSLSKISILGNVNESLSFWCVSDRFDRLLKNPLRFQSNKVRMRMLWTGLKTVPKTEIKAHSLRVLSSIADSSFWFRRSFRIASLFRWATISSWSWYSWWARAFRSISNPSVASWMPKIGALESGSSAGIGRGL